MRGFIWFDFDIAKKKQISWDRFMLFYQFPFSSQSQALSWTHIFTKIVVRLILLLSDDLYVPNLNANPQKKNSLPQWFIMHFQK